MYSAQLAQPASFIFVLLLPFIPAILCPT